MAFCEVLDMHKSMLNISFPAAGEACPTMTGEPAREKRTIPFAINPSSSKFGSFKEPMVELDQANVSWDLGHVSYEAI